MVLVLAGIVMLLAGVVTMPSPAAAGGTYPAAYEENFAVDVEWTDTHKHCLDPSSDHGANGCVQAYGDVLWVLDRWADGHGVSMTWRELDSNGNPTGRHGKCIDNLGASVGWTVCDKDFTEGNIIEWTLDYWRNGGWVQVGHALTSV
jgi:hypothetical protein